MNGIKREQVTELTEIKSSKAGVLKGLLGS